MTGKRLREFREKMEFHLKDLSFLLDVDLNTLSKWERDKLGIRHPSWLAVTLENIQKNYNSLQETGKNKEDLLKEVKKRLKNKEKMTWVQNH